MSSVLFSDWVWSHSRITLFEQCPYAFALKYIYEEPNGKTNFYAGFGSYMHRIHELFYTGVLKQDELVQYYIEHFDEVGPHKGRSKYFVEGLNYFEGGMLVTPSSIVGVEQRINFKVGEYDFTGIIDLLYENEDGTLTICDHKSHPLQPRSKRKKPTLSDKELDQYLKQLYLYAHGVHQLGLGNVGALQFNCFRARTTVSEEYSEAKEEEAVEWAINTIHNIEDTSMFYPVDDWFYCHNLCDHREVCEYK